METSGRTIRGVAIVTNSWSKDLGGFREMISPEAINEQLIKKSDVMLNIDHDPSRVLARSKRGKGSLKLFLTERGLEFETECPNTSAGNDLLELMKRGDYSQCSFCFSLPREGGDEWDGLNRTIRKIDRLYDVSVVFDPAYDATECDARSMEMVNLYSRLNDLEKTITDIFPYD